MVIIKKVKIISLFLPIFDFREVKKVKKETFAAQNKNHCGGGDNK